MSWVSQFLKKICFALALVLSPVSALADTEDGIKAFNAKQYEVAVQILRDDGSYKARLLLGKMHQEGLGGLQKSYAKAAELYQSVVDTNSIIKLNLDNMQQYPIFVEAEFALANLYRVGGFGLEKSDAKAFAHLNEAAEYKHPGAHLWLALYYEKGLGGAEQADVKAAESYHFAAEKGIPNAMLKLAQFYVNGRGIGKNPFQAAKIYSILAQKGDPRAAGLLQAIQPQITKWRQTTMRPEWAVGNWGQAEKDGKGGYKVDSRLFSHTCGTGDVSDSFMRISFGSELAFMYTHDLGDLGGFMGEVDFSDVYFENMAENKIRLFPPKWYGGWLDLKLVEPNILWAEQYAPFEPENILKMESDEDFYVAGEGSFFLQKCE